MNQLGASKRRDVPRAGQQDLQGFKFPVVTAFGQTHPPDFDGAADGNGSQVQIRCGLLAFGGEGEVGALQDQDGSADFRITRVPLDLAHRSIDQLPLQRDQAPVVQSLAQVGNRHRPSADVRLRFAELSATPRLAARADSFPTREIPPLRRLPRPRRRSSDGCGLADPRSHPAEKLFADSLVSLTVPLTCTRLPGGSSCRY